MISILFTIILGMNSYTVINSCIDMGGVNFPADDAQHNRVLSVCVIDPDQTHQIVEHELLHICAHDHRHAFSSKEELRAHLDEPQTEEYFATVIAPCLVVNYDKLYKAFQDHNVPISGYGKSDRPGINSR